jgi:hypothetical protein
MGSYEGRGPQTDKTSAAKSLYRSIFLDNDICQSNLSTEKTVKVNIGHAYLPSYRNSLAA